MIKSFLKKPKKVIVSSILLGLLFIGSAYAYFTSGWFSLTDDTLAFSSALNISYILEGKTNLTFNINGMELLQGGKSYVDSKPATALVTLGNNSEYDNFTCKYEIWYNPTKPYTNSAEAGDLQEMVIIGSDSSNQNTGFTLDLNGVTKAQKLKDCTISVQSKNANETQTWTFILRHYNLNVNQNDNINKIFGGYISLKPLGCKPEQ